MTLRESVIEILEKHGDSTHDEKSHGNRARAGTLRARPQGKTRTKPTDTSRKKASANIFYHGTKAKKLVAIIAAEGLKSPALLSPKAHSEAVGFYEGDMEMTSQAAEVRARSVFLTSTLGKAAEYASSAGTIGLVLRIVVPAGEKIKPDELWKDQKDLFRMERGIPPEWITGVATATSETEVSEFVSLKEAKRLFKAGRTYYAPVAL